ncbi:hypothetical protein CDL12_29793 [Handroanthus impetiginosus]|uniref:Uncharacterized protein n=1 Tax=Handroanthus impetiginosus TaxID=429701 RepID=A0A2G9FXE9_9LAMI|nr:hypothetical protein CDL12_29793 [Handroanthus impetiginosus]
MKHLKRELILWYVSRLQTLLSIWLKKNRLEFWFMAYTAATGVASSRARTPGSSFPSKSSKLAPPPVDMWLITLATPTFSIAATESPPPIIVVTPFPLSSASLYTSIPTANLSNSNTPIGPFQITVCVVSRVSLNVFTESDGTLLSASGANLSAITTSVGSKRFTPLALAFSRSDVARSSLSCSTRDDPTDSPCAL